MDLYSRKVLSWRLSNSMDPAFCVSALQEALEKYGTPAIFNTDHPGRSLRELLGSASECSQFTSAAFTGLLEAYQIEISMDGVGRALDNVYVERLWRSLKFEDIYLKDYQSMR